MKKLLILIITLTCMGCSDSCTTILDPITGISFDQEDNFEIVFALILFLHFFLNFKKTEFAAATLICCPTILLQRE